MTETEDAIDVLNHIGKHQIANNGIDYWHIYYDDDFIMVKKETDQHFCICRSFYGKSYTGYLGPFEVLEELARRYPSIAIKLAKPIEEIRK